MRYSSDASISSKAKVSIETLGPVIGFSNDGLGVMVAPILANTNVTTELLGPLMVLRDCRNGVAVAVTPIKLKPARLVSRFSSGGLIGP